MFLVLLLFMDGNTNASLGMASSVNWSKWPLFITVRTSHTNSGKLCSGAAPNNHSDSCYVAKISRPVDVGQT